MASQYVTLPENGGGSSAGVSSLNGITGDVLLVAGTNITLTPFGQSITIAASGGGGGITSINADTTAAQLIVSASSGTDFTISTTAGTTTIAIPTASSSKRGLLSSADWTTFNSKGSGTVTSVGLTDSTGLFTVTGSPVTSSGSLTLSAFASQAQHAFLGGPSGASGAAAFRTLVASDIPSLSATYLPLTGGTLSGALVLPNGAVGTPALVSGRQATDGLYFSAAGAVDVAVGGVKAIEISSNNLAIGSGSTATTGFSIGVASNSYNFMDAASTFLTYYNVTGNIGYGAAIGSQPGYPFSFYAVAGAQSNITNPASQVYRSSTIKPPVTTTLNNSTTVGTFGGAQNAGNSHNINGGIYFFNDTQTSGSEDSHIELWTANAGTYAKKVIVDKSGQLAIQVAGSGLSITEGSNCKQGTAVLVGGTVTVTNSAITASSRVFLTTQVAGGTIGVLSLGTVTAGTSFVINSSSALDTSTVAYFITEPS